MELVIIGSLNESAEIRTKFGDNHQYHFFEDHKIETSMLTSVDVLFDFLPLKGTSIYSKYMEAGSMIIFANSIYNALNSFVIPENGNLGRIFGFNGLSTFLQRKYLEVSCYNNQKGRLSEVCSQLETEYLLVDDRVGLVTPRVIAMIINEAYYTVQEGTAEKEAIDQAMKLGTNYPYGPFEWSEKIGLENVYRLLKALYDDTMDERYKICALLKKEVKLMDNFKDN